MEVAQNVRTSVRFSVCMYMSVCACVSTNVHVCVRGYIHACM